MTLPPLENFEENIHKLHQAAKLFPPICNVLLEKQQNWLHIAMQPHLYGFSTQAFPQGGKLVLNTEESAVFYYRGSGGAVPFPLKLYTQKSLFEGILQAMSEDEFVGFFDDLAGDSLTEKLLGKIYAKKPEALPDAIEEHSKTGKLILDTDAINAYMQALDMIYTGIARWRARVNGHLSPAVVWGEHFDLSTLWFKDADMDEYKPHINIGFAPFTEGVFERPYLYAYAYPYAENYTAPELTAPLKWETEAYTGIYVAYDDLAATGATVYDVEKYVSQMFEALKSVLA